MKQVLYLSYTGMTEPLGRSQVLAYLEGLAATGQYSFTIISFEKADSFRQEAEQVRAFCQAHGFKWHPLNYTKKPPVLSTFRDVRRMRRLATKLYRQYKFDLVHCRSYIASLTGHWLKKRFGVPFLFDMRGFWPEERVDGGLWRLGNPLYRGIYSYFKKKEKAFLLEADYIVSLTENGRQELLSRQLRPEPLPIQVIPCCVDLELFDPSQINEQKQQAVREALHLPERSFVLSYLGTLGTWYLLREMLLFFKELLKKKPEALFLFVTREPREMILDEAAAAGVPAACLRIVSAGRSEVPLFLSLSQYSIFFIKPAFSKKASSPVKQGEIMAMGIPVICNEGIGDTSLVVNQFNSGLVVAEMNEISFQKVAAEGLKRTFKPEKIRAGADSFFSLREGVARYARVYEKVLGK